MERVFVVGCSRSGTSLVHKKLVEEFSLYSIPETAFFYRDLSNVAIRAWRIANLNRVLLGESIGVGKRKYFGFIKNFARSAASYGPIYLAKAVLSKKESELFFFKVMDEEANARGMKGWLEKTPLHFLNIDDIRENHQDAKFIYLLRKGEDVVASIEDRARKYSKSFGWQEGGGYAIDLWNKSVDIAYKNLDKKNVKLVMYEEVVTNYEAVLEDIERFLELPRGEGGVANVVGDHEKWKSNVMGELKLPESKFFSLFSEPERMKISRSLNKYVYSHIASKIEKEKSVHGE